MPSKKDAKNSKESKKVKPLSNEKGLNSGSDNKESNKTKITKPQKVKPPIKKDRIEKGELTFEGIMKAFEYSKGNVNKTCKLLNIAYSSFRDYMHKYPELEKAKNEYFEAQKQDIGKTAIDVLIDVAMSENVGGAMGNINLSGSRVKAAETLAKIAGILVDKQQIQSDNLNRNVSLDHLSDEELDNKIRLLESLNG
jgi:TolA-binding protein